jgi:cytochrome c2
MPATETTWRDLKLMHVFFGLTSLGLLVGTIWMLAADHDREWKQLQRDFRDVQVWSINARLAELETGKFKSEQEQLKDKLAAARREVPPAPPIERFCQLMLDKDAADKTQANQSKVEEIRAQYKALQAATDDDQRTARRAELVNNLSAIIVAARNQETKIADILKATKADLNVAVSDYDIGTRDNVPQTDMDRLQKAIDDVQVRVNERTLESQAANTYRKNLEAALAEATASETQAQKDIDDFQSRPKQLAKAEQEQERSFGERFLELPIIDAFGRPLKVNQIWLPQLTTNINFRDVARFDRCITCHQGISLTAPGSAVDPAYHGAEILTFTLATPEAPPQAAGDKPATAASDSAGNAEPTIETIYGMKLADKLRKGNVAIQAVWPDQPAAKASRVVSGGVPEVAPQNPPGTLQHGDAVNYAQPAGLRAGDVIERVNDIDILSLSQAENALLSTPTWGKPLTLRVRRGASQPFSSHPRLDLYVGDASPHSAAKVGCTICHDGQGNATTFQWASHSPDSELQREEWAREHGYAFNHDWWFPMFPNRFSESTCLKCHHNLGELEPSPRFPEPPAPKLMEGYHLVRQFGCFGCHEINGYDGPNKRIGPDLRSEPNVTAAAQQLLTDAGVNDEEKLLASTLVSNPYDRTAFARLAELLRADQTRAAAKAEQAGQDPPHLSAPSFQLLSVLGAPDELPGKQRKVGPSLRHLASKVDFNFVYDWIREPKHFRPTTRMPQFFGLWDHLVPVVEPDGDGHEKIEASKGLKDAERFEPIEIRGITQYLLGHSQPFEFAENSAGVTAEASAERGRKLFETRGCLACHQHPDFPDAKADQGPSLGNLGSKLTTENGRRWLYSWLRDPSAYHPRTVMPNLFLDPIKQRIGEQEQTTDPAGDIAAYLLAPREGDPEYKPQVPDHEPAEADVNDLVLLHLKKAFTEVQAAKYLKEGIPADRAADVPADERVLVAPLTPEKKYEYVGRKAISKYGCTGCHDVPGYETAKSIGTGLADWGRKEADKLAFEQIDQYIAWIEHAHGGGHGEAPHSEANHGDAAHAGAGDAHGHDGPASEDTPAGLEAFRTRKAAEIKAYDPDGLFVHELGHHHRMGFLWNKIREPRSYDFKKTENKDYNDRLRMPKFNFTPDQLEAVMTFVLGLLAEPPAAQYVYKPSPRQQAVNEGKHVLEKYNCGGCHTLEMPHWQFEYDPKQLTPPAETNDYAFLSPHFAPATLEDSAKTDARGLGSADIAGMPMVDGEGKLVEDVDENDNPLYFFTLWQNKPIAGQAYTSGTQLGVTKPQLTSARPAWGGYLSRLIYPSVLATAREENPNFKDSDAWGWLPPPLVGEGRKVQPAWLHDFLLDPVPIRPAVVLRMPKFNMSTEEAGKLVDYFAAADGAEYPYALDPRTRGAHLTAAESAHPNRLSDAMKIVTNGNYCVKCHHLGDFVPEGSVYAMAPNLDRVYRRLRPDYVRDWVANPPRIIPYTVMPINIPPDKPIAQEIYHGTSEEQLQAVVDLLMNYDVFMKDRTSIRPMIQAAPPEAAAGQAAGGE